jgi:uncharacterized protein DUF732
MIYPSEPTTEKLAAPQPAAQLAPLPNQERVVELGFPAVCVGFIAVLVLVLVLIGVGLAAAAPASAMSSSQTKFVKDVRDLGPTATSASNRQIVKLGNKVCTDLRSGTSVKRLASVLSGTEKAILVEAATVLCPTYKAKVASYYATTTTTAPTTTAAPNGVYSMGTVVSVPINVNGINKAATYGFYPNVTTDHPNVDKPPSGDTYGAVDAGECAGPSGASNGVDPSDFSVVLSNGSTAQSDTVVGNMTIRPIASESQLGSSTSSLSAGQCQRGWIIFDMPQGVTPTYVEFVGTTASITSSNSVAKWTIPA